MVKSFHEQGYLGPIEVLTPEECQLFLRSTRDASEPPALDWFKGHAATSRTFYDLATRPALLDVVVALLGKNVLLWGACVVSRPSGKSHPWHTDIETAEASSKSVSVWIGLENTGADSSLAVVPYSQRFGVTVQQVRRQNGTRWQDPTDDDITNWARQFDPRSAVVKLPMNNGQALFFAGQLWHSSFNHSATTRRALLLQYAAPETPIRIPVLNDHDWPFRQLPVPRPACILLRGNDKAGVNRVVPGPVMPNKKLDTQLTSRVHALELPLPVDEDTAWKPFPLFKGSTAGMHSLACHVSVLRPGQCPHPPHAHKEQELLLVLHGEVELNLPQAGPETRIHLTRGQCVYYPQNFPHTLTTTSATPANYLMLKWHSGPHTTPTPLPFTRTDVLAAAPSDGGALGFAVQKLFEGPTQCLRKLQCHASTLAPGAGYDAHIDAHDVVIVVLEGEVETLGEVVRAHGVIFYAAGEPHGMRNPGATTARYVVFEFHSSQTPLVEKKPPAPAIQVEPKTGKLAKLLLGVQKRIRRFRTWRARSVSGPRS